MKKSKYLIIGILLCLSCRYERSTLSKFVVSNNTNEVIRIFPTLSLADTLLLLPNETKEFDQGSNRGLSDGINFAFFADGYPVTVMFNLTDTIIHYRDTLTHSKNYYKETDKRNFYNTSSYSKEIISNSKYTQSVTLKYVFTNADYLDAKK
jgi:hypothetical protein